MSNFSRNSMEGHNSPMKEHAIFQKYPFMNIGTPKTTYQPENKYESLAEVGEDPVNDKQNPDSPRKIPVFHHQSLALFSVPTQQTQQTYYIEEVAKDQKPLIINYSNMYELIDEQVETKTIKNWKYPEVFVDACDSPYEEPKDLPNAIRWVDVVLGDHPKIELKGKELAQFLEAWKYVASTDDVRYPHAHNKGGKTPENPKCIEKIRVIAKDFFMNMGKHILSGKLNLTTVPFPIKAMIPKSYLEYVGSTPTGFFPLYLNLAMKNTDPLQRFKFYMVANICYFYLTTSFAKPLNPILGETFSGHYNDGSKIYLEQISHHPPVSYILYHGPKDAYKFWGPSIFSAHAGLNSMTIAAKGWRKMLFKDNNQLIYSTFPNESYSNTMWGTCRHETICDMEFKDEGNKIDCKIHFGKTKGKASDYFDGTINVDGLPVSKISGTYLGWIEIDGFRYFDFRHCLPFEVQNENTPLHSDFQYRSDLATLELGDFEKAQKEKELLEHIQRTDAKLRKQNKPTKGKH